MPVGDYTLEVIAPGIVLPVSSPRMFRPAETQGQT
jgi:hypothetical protein